MEIAEIFSKNLARIRSEIGLRADDISKSCGIHPTQLSGYENGRVMPTIETVARLATALGVQPWELLRDPSLPPTRKELRRAVLFLMERVLRD